MESVAQVDIDKYLFTSNEEMDAIQAGDSTIEVIGAITAIDNGRKRQNAGGSQVRLFRAVLSNGQGRQLRLLFWEDRADQFETKIYRMVLHITRAKAVLANPQYARPAERLMPIELSITRNTEIQIIAPMTVIDRPEPLLNMVSLANIAGATGMVLIEGYIRYEFMNEIYGQYGSGDITDGIYHVNVHITNFQGPSLPVGTPVSIKGEPRRNNYNNIIIQVPDMNHIEVLPDVENMSPQKLRGGWRKPPNELIQNAPAGLTGAGRLPRKNAVDITQIDPVATETVQVDLHQGENLQVNVQADVHQNETENSENINPNSEKNINDIVENEPEMKKRKQ